MRKTLRVFVILVISLVVMVACNNDDTATEDNGDSINESTGEIDQTETDDIYEDSDEATDENLDSPEIDGEGEVPILELGETGVIEDTLGTYEVTVTGFSLETEMSEDDPYKVTKNGYFIIVDVSIKNIGEDILEATSITKTDLFNATGAGVTNFTSFNSINNFEGEVSPNDTVEGQLLFDLSEEDYYELAFGFGMPSHISNEVRWALHAEDAE